MSSITVYQADPQGFFLYATEAYELPLQLGDFNVPYGALIDAPPAATQGYVARAGENGWQLVEDHRQDRLFYVLQPAAGDELAVFAEYVIGSEVSVDGQELRYDGGGPVPAWLIAQLPEKGRLLVPSLE